MKKLSGKILSVLLIVAMLIPTGVMGVTSSAETSEPCLILTVHQGGNVSNLDIIFKYSLINFCLYSFENIYIPNGAVIKLPIDFSSIIDVSFEAFLDSFNFINTSLVLEGGEHLSYSYSFGYAVPDTDALIPTGKQFPEGYNFNDDRWNFSNFSETIDLKYYTGLYGIEKGTELHNYSYINGKSPHGHCFGMAVSTSATLVGGPYVKDYISWTGLPYQKLSSVNKGTTNIDMNISAKDYIKYCHIYQASAFACRQRNSDDHNGIKNVYNAVRNASLSNNDSTLIVIDLWGGPGGHTVYAAGIDGDDILVNDSNAPGSIQKINIFGDEWTYSAGGFNWNSGFGATIGYVENCIEPYARLTRHAHVEGGTIPENSAITFSYTEYSEINGTNNYYSTNIKPIDTDKLLVVSEKDSFTFSESECMFKLANTNGAGEYNENGLYWLDIGDTINAENMGGDSAMLKLVGNELKISAQMPADSSVIMKINENGDNFAEFDIDDNQEIAVTFTTLDENDEFVNLIITGTASGDNVTATETENGVQVTGLNNITATYETADGTGTTEIEITNGKTVDIVVNDEKNSVDIDWNCSHLCHKDNAFVQFIWKIINFLSKIFGASEYCDCGMKHW